MITRIEKEAIKNIINSILYDKTKLKSYNKDIDDYDDFEYWDGKCQTFLTFLTNIIKNRVSQSEQYDYFLSVFNYVQTLRIGKID